MNNQWIPVSERLPETNKDVQVTFREYMEYCKKYRYGICKAIYIPKYSVTNEEMNWDNDDTNYDYLEKEDKYYVPSGWYEVVENWSDYTHVYISCEVTAWQPLPEPYQGGSQDEN